jgi:tungstate transport system substrate-binding protein
LADVRHVPDAVRQQAASTLSNNLRMVNRRALLVGGLGLGAGAGSAAQTQSRHPVGGAIRLGADSALVDSGLAHALQRAFTRDTGLAVQLAGAAALPLLDALAADELDVALCNTPVAELRLDGQGLVHDRRPIASGEFVLVGPARPINAALRLAKGETRSASDALSWLHASATAQASDIQFFSANDRSGAHVAEENAWRAARLAPAAPWYQPATAGRSVIAQARERGAYAVVERGAWAAQGGAPLAILVEGDRQLAEDVHAMRSFRSPHPAGRMFVAWIAGARGRAVVAAQRGYRVPTA